MSVKVVSVMRKVNKKSLNEFRLNATIIKPIVSGAVSISQSQPNKIKNHTQTPHSGPEIFLKSMKKTRENQINQKILL